MKKLFVAIVVVLAMSILSSCNIKELKEKYGYTEKDHQQTKINHDEVGDEDDDDQQEGNN